MNKFLQEAYVPKWMTKGKTRLTQDPIKGTAQSNFRPITCQPMILTAQIKEKIYYSLSSRRLFLEEQKGYRKRSRDTAELLDIDQHILTKTRRKNQATAWTDIVPESWMINCLKMYKISHKQ